MICSDLGNAGSLISDGVTGFKFPADSAEQLAQTLNRYSTRNPSAKAR